MFEKQIEAGVAYLDEQYSRNTWLPRINLDILDQASNSRCILGQLEKSYVDYSITHGLTAKWAETRGFCVLFQSFDELDEHFRAYDTLTSEWKQTISALRG